MSRNSTKLQRLQQKPQVENDVEISSNTKDQVLVDRTQPPNPSTIDGIEGQPSAKKRKMSTADIFSSKPKFIPLDAPLLPDQQETSMEKGSKDLRRENIAAEAAALNDTRKALGTEKKFREQKTAREQREAEDIAKIKDKFSHLFDTESEEE